MYWCLALRWNEFSHKLHNYCCIFHVVADLSEDVFSPEHHEEVRTYNSTMTGEFCGNMTIPHSLLLKPADFLSRAAVGCQKSHDVRSEIDVRDDLTLINIDVTNIDLNLGKDLSLTLINCVLADTTIFYKLVNGSIALQFVNTTFRGHLHEYCTEELNCNTSSWIRGSSKNLTVWYLNSTFLQTTQKHTGTFINKVNHFCLVLPFCGATGTFRFGLQRTLPMAFNVRVDSTPPVVFLPFHVMVLSHRSLGWGLIQKHQEY